MDLSIRVINRILTITEAMYSLVLAVPYLMSRTLPKPAFDAEHDNSLELAHELVNTINKYLSNNSDTSHARIMLSLSLIMEILMEDLNGA